MAVKSEVGTTRASVTKQYNLVPASGRCYLAAGSVAMGLASHWPRVTDICSSPPTGSRPWSGRWTLAYVVFGAWLNFTFFWRERLDLDWSVVWCRVGRLELLCCLLESTPTDHNCEWTMLQTFIDSRVLLWKTYGNRPNMELSLEKYAS